MEFENKKILIVEDNENDVELIKRKFRIREINTRVFVVNDGEEALDYMHHRGEFSDPGKYPVPDLIILDIRMPKVNGIEVLREIKSNKMFKSIPVVMLTVSTLKRDIFDTFDAGGEHYVAKSVAFEKFESTVEPIIMHYLNK